MFMRGTKFQLRTAFSAGLLPPLRQLSEAISQKVNRKLADGAFLFFEFDIISK
jgi:hypothetical protein